MNQPRANHGGKIIPPNPTPFLTAEWRSLLMLNYEVDADTLKPYQPAGVELDLFEGRALVSLVGFRFLNTRVRGFAIPLHRNFDELNLRFYVLRRMEDGSVRRGVTFIREIVPRWAIAAVARWVYDEPYLSLPMRHRLELEQATQRIEYSFRYGGYWNQISGVPSGDWSPAEAEPATAFITEHYWGYTRRGPEDTSEYQVVHPTWQVQTVLLSRFDGDAGRLYGPEFVTPLSKAPLSAFLAEGSAVAVYPGMALRGVINRTA